jgi:potassium efflux system protein
VFFVFAVAFVAGAAGYMSLAVLLGSGVLGSGYLALVFYAGVRVADALVAFALRVRPLRLLGMVERRRPLIELRAHGLLRWLAIGGWLIFALRYFGLWSWAVALLQTALRAEFRRGFLRFSLGDILLFALTVWAAFLVSALVRFVLEEDVYPRLRLGRGLPQVLSSVLHYALLLAGFLVALAALGVDLTKVTILAGAFGVGIGFGLQNVVNNFVSGVVVLFERRIDVGDTVQIGDVTGRMQQMGIRSCTVRTWEGAEVIVPNAMLISDKVTNWTLSDRRRRIDLAVGVAYGTAPERMLDLMLGVARAHPSVLADPAPAAVFRGFGDSALLFQLLCWTDRFELWIQIQSELAVALYGALREAGIEIPFPQHDVRLRQQ